ncbi:hypothetical protein VQ045_20195, partial [Aurantimonas sp. E1-2-R+4]|uniref:hypothetical protein n=1 Tax=Aurantimonas sp. E1-2-R+4 TaxID=3113714 RepID=UPI002F921BEA
RPLLRSLEQARRSALENHVHRNARLGAWVLISARWYYVAFFSVFQNWPRAGRIRFYRHIYIGGLASLR